jgi:hypothetical protein
MKITFKKMRAGGFYARVRHPLFNGETIPDDGTKATAREMARAIIRGRSGK